VQRYFRNGERLENGEWFYSTPRVFEEFQHKFPDFQGTYQPPAQKVYKCVNMFLETGSVLSKKSQWTTDKKKTEVEQRIAETPNKSIWRLTQETNLSVVQFSLSLKKICTFFPTVCLLCMKLDPLTISAPTT
jgi:hypothetical protein